MKRAMVDRKDRVLSVTRQCRILSVSRSSLYYKRKGESAYNLELMTLIDKQFLDTPFYGVRQMTWHLKGEGHKVNKKRIRRLMRLMGLTPIYQKTNTSKPNKAHKIYPYLLGGVKITEANQVWCADITYIPMRKGFLYLVAIMDWATRRVLSWRFSNTMDTDFCVEALNEAILRFGPPKIFNTDQGSQFTSFKWTDNPRSNCALAYLARLIYGTNPKKKPVPLLKIVKVERNSQKILALNLRTTTGFIQSKKLLNWLKLKK